MMRFLVAVCVLGASVAGAQEKDVPLAEIDKWYAAEGAKERDTQIDAFEKRLASLNKHLATLTARKASPNDLESVRVDRDETEAILDELKANPTTPPYLMPTKLAVGQAGYIQGAEKFTFATARVKRLLPNDDVLIRIENTDVELIVKCLPDSVEVGDSMDVSQTLQVVGKRSISGKGYLYLRLYTPPDQRKP